LLNNSAFDVSGGKFCLTALVETCKILGLDQGPGQGVERWSNLLNKLPPYLINSDGALQEWGWPGLKDNYIHRHLSHMLPVWPFREISPEATPELFNAAAVVLAKKRCLSRNCRAWNSSRRARCRRVEERRVGQQALLPIDEGRLLLRQLDLIAQQQPRRFLHRYLQRRAGNHD